MTERNVAELVEKVNKLLLEGEPENTSKDDFAGYVGYKPQYIVDALNEVFGFGMWGFEELSSEVIGTEKVPQALVVAQVRVWLKDVSFQPIAWGQARITKGDVGDARKGAGTDAMKKALSYFSIGSRAYKGLLVKPPEQADNEPRQLPSRKQAQPPKKDNPTPPASVGNTQVDASAPSPQQLDSIRKMCGMLKRHEVPTVTTFADAKTLITSLSRELAEKRKAS